MKSDIKNVTAFLAVAIWADSVHSKGRNDMLIDIVGTPGIDSAPLIQQIQETVNTLEDKDDDAVWEYLVNNASAIEEDRTKRLLQCAVGIMVTNNVITAGGIRVLFDPAGVTDGEAEHANVTFMLLDLTKYSPEIEVEFQPY